MIKLIVGLGNPGPEYAQTRHNAGFWWVQGLADARGWALDYDKGFQGRVAKGTLKGHTLWLLQPQTFMNLSGRSVAALARFFKIVPEEVLVAHDELDLAVGQAKLKFGGGHAGHNGLRDIHSQLGSADYWRLRLGIGHPGHKPAVVQWVLQKPSLDERIAIDQAMTRAQLALEDLVLGDMNKATATIHTDKPPRPPSGTKPHSPKPSGAQLATNPRENTPCGNGSCTPASSSLLP